jgi:hypothetical protein
VLGLRVLTAGVAGTHLGEDCAGCRDELARHRIDQVQFHLDADRRPSIRGEVDRHVVTSRWSRGSKERVEVREVEDRGSVRVVVVVARGRSAIPLDRFCDLLGSCRRGETLDDVALGIDEELLEVPGDLGAVAVAGLRLGLEPLVERCGAVTVDVDLVEHRERDAELRRGEFEDLGVRSGFLPTELVAREAEDGNIVVVVMERTQTCVLRREASSARDVDDQTELVPELLERHRVAGDRDHLEVVER